VHAPRQKIVVQPRDLDPADYTVCTVQWSLFQERVYRTNISDIDELKRRINSEWAALSHAHIERAVGECMALASTRLRSCWRRTFFAHVMWCDFEMMGDFFR